MNNLRIILSASPSREMFTRINNMNKSKDSMEKALQLGCWGPNTIRF
ncbi:hypothetical protein Patl1_04530 [Pistacia atlantica]|uniref:Uncharacterized protein n=1 Tax=Pistacia atlantica TaxID=434234 RepID=A0ACC1BP46_9ROSI|nr:hypothetical protein Patl1_04530 [Pistacia atlantica]